MKELNTIDFINVYFDFGYLNLYLMCTSMWSGVFKLQ